MKKAMTPTLMVVIALVFLITSVLLAEEQGIEGTCTLPPNTPGIQVKIYKGVELIASTITNPSGNYHVDYPLETGTHYHFFATDGLGTHNWYFVYAGSLMHHDFALGVG